MRRLLVLSLLLVSAAATSTAEANDVGLPFYKGTTAYDRAAYHEKWIPKVKAVLRASDGLLVDEGISQAKVEKQLRRMQANYRDARQIIKDYEEAQAALAAQAPVLVSSSGISGDDGTYNCGLQFWDGWMDGSAGNPVPVCGDRASQIAAAEWIAQNSANDPWPNCPDPYRGGEDRDGDGDVDWDDTADCENGGDW